MSQFTEKQVRFMRDMVYVAPSTDKNWDACRNAWMQPAEMGFLERQFRAREVRLGITTPLPIEQLK